MRVPRNWNDYLEVRNAVVEALDEHAAEHDNDNIIRSGNGPDGYGGEGYIEIKIHHRTFSLSLNEEY